MLLFERKIKPKNKIKPTNRIKTKSKPNPTQKTEETKPYQHPTKSTAFCFSTFASHFRFTKHDCYTLPENCVLNNIQHYGFFVQIFIFQILKEYFSEVP